MKETANHRTDRWLVNCVCLMLVFALAVVALVKLDDQRREALLPPGIPRMGWLFDAPEISSLATLSGASYGVCWLPNATLVARRWGIEPAYRGPDGLSATVQTTLRCLASYSPLPPTNWSTCACAHHSLMWYSGHPVITFGAHDGDAFNVTIDGLVDANVWCDAKYIVGCKR